MGYGAKMSHRFRAGAKVGLFCSWFVRHFCLTFRRFLPITVLSSNEDRRRMAA
jgi:hypothetical protein